MGLEVEVDSIPTCSAYLLDRHLRLSDAVSGTLLANWLLFWVLLGNQKPLARCCSILLAAGQQLLLAIAFLRS
jgi:hypothetical protein